jgi:hypothetical protein
MREKKMSKTFVLLEAVLEDSFVAIAAMGRKGTPRSSFNV